MEKEKNQTICTTTFKEKTRRKSIDFVINPRGAPMSLHAGDGFVWSAGILVSGGLGALGGHLRILWATVVWG